MEKGTVGTGDRCLQELGYLVLQAAGIGVLMTECSDLSPMCHQPRHQTSPLWLLTPILSVVGRARQEDYKFEASTGYLSTSGLCCPSCLLQVLPSQA